MTTMAELAKYKRKTDNQGNDWYPAGGGSEKPFYTKNRRHLLYCWCPQNGKHAYLDCQTDLLLTDEEAYAILSKF